MNSQIFGRCLKLKYKDIKPCKIYSFLTAKKVRIYHIHNLIYWCLITSKLVINPEYYDYIIYSPPLFQLQYILKEKTYQEETLYILYQPK